jgi:hypothetical protein
MRNKTHRNDARGIARMMRSGRYRAVHAKNVEMQRMRTLLSDRKLLKRKLIDIENHIWGSLRVYGLLIGAVIRGCCDARVRELLERCDPIFVITIEAMLDVRRAIFEGYERLHRVLLQVVQHDPVCRRFLAIPGVARYPRSMSPVRSTIPRGSAARAMSLPIFWSDKAPSSARWCSKTHTARCAPRLQRSTIGLYRNPCFPSKEKAALRGTLSTHASFSCAGKHE